MTPRPPDRCLIRYDRDGDVLRVTLRGITNHELREVLTGLWSRLPPADRRDHIAELRHYEPYLRAPERYPARFLSPVAEAIRRGEESDEAVSLRDIPAPDDRS